MPYYSFHGEMFSSLLNFMLFYIWRRLQGQEMDMKRVGEEWNQDYDVLLIHRESIKCF